MPVPDYQSFMRPLLSLLSDGRSWKIREIYVALAQQTGLSEADMAEMLPSGRQPTYMNRIGWAKTYLVKAGALQSPQRGTVQITERGMQLLAQDLEINTQALSTFAEFQEFKNAHSHSASPNPATPAPVIMPTLSPEEQLETVAAELNQSLKNDLLAQAMSLTPAQFERLVVEVLVAMGYGGSVRDAGQALGRSGDDGIDGLIKQDPLGLDRIYVQAKRWQNNVGSPEIRNFAGSLTFHRAIKGVFITTSTFSEAARSTASQIGNIILIDGEQLAELMISYGVGVSTRATYRIHRIDSEYFDEL